MKLLTSIASIFLVAIVATLAYAAATERCQCGVERLGQKIINGTPAEPYAYGWMVALWNKKSKTVQCGAALINDRYLLTAAHCFFEEDTEELIIDDVIFYAGLYNVTLRHEATLLEMESYTIHEKYDDDAWFDNDIAIIRLKNPVKFTDRISPICLPTANLRKQGSKRGHFTNLRVAGWGIRKYGDIKSNPDVLYNVTVYQMNHSYCKDKLYPTMEGQYPKIRPNQICAGSDAGDSCGGDSGGPLMTYFRGRHYIVGVVSWGHYCGNKIHPGIYARISSHARWISDNMKKDVTWCASKE